MTPELKSPSVPMPFEGNYTQEAYAQQMIDEYKAAGVKPENVFAQSFMLNDILYWLKNEPEFGKQAVFLDEIEQFRLIAAIGLSGQVGGASENGKNRTLRPGERA